MKNNLEQKLQAMAGKLPEGVNGTRSITVLDGEILRTVSGGGSRVNSGGGGGGGSGSGSGSGGGGGSGRR